MDAFISREWEQMARILDRLCDEITMLKCGWTPSNGWYVDQDIRPELQMQFLSKGWTPPADRPRDEHAPEQTPEAPPVKAPPVKAPPPGFEREPEAPPQQAPKAPSHQLSAYKAPPAGWPFVQQTRFKAPPEDLERRQQPPPPHPPVHKAPPAGWLCFEQAPQAPPPQTAVAANFRDVFGSPPSSIDSMR